MIEEIKVAYLETLARKRAEFEASIERGEIADPITGTIFTIAALKAIAISAAVSVAVSAASYGLSRAFAPRPPRQQFGKMTGSLQLQNSEQGLFIPEIYGAGPEVTLVTGADPTWQNLTNTTGGANGAITKTGGAANTYDAGASHNVAVTTGDAFIEVIAGTGAATAGFSSTASPTNDADMLFGIQWHHYGTIQVKTPADLSVDIGHWVVGDKFRIEIRNGRFRLYQNSAELSGFSVPVPAVTYPLYFGIAMYASGAGVSNTKVQIGDIGEPPNAGRGGIKVPAIIVWTSGIRKNTTVTQQPVRGGKGGGHRTQTVENISYDIDLRLNFARGPLRLLREYANADINLDQFAQSANPSGVYDPTVSPDSPYDPDAPPNPQTDYPTHRRVDGPIDYDGNNTGTGTIQGGGSLFAIYEGNGTQEPDPTEEADIDGKYGTGSTTAYHNTFGIVHKQFDLSRTSGIVPNFTAALEHTSLKTLDDIFASFCERVNVLAANDDYDFTGLSEIASRGMLIAGRLFQPAEVIGSPEIELAYNYFVTEVEGQLVGYAEGDEPSVTIADTEVGWLDGESEVPDIIPEVESVIASEIGLEREVVVKFIDPDKEWDMNTQSAKRQITEGVGTEVLEVQLAFLTDEARAIAQRKLYRDYVAGSAHKFTLPWTYLYLHPGYKIIINRAEGFTHTLRLTSISGGIGVLDCEGIAIEPEVFNQPATGSTGIPGNPPQMIPAMTVISMLDTPLLRDGDITNNDGLGWYVVGTPRTGFNQSWQGFVLVMYKNNQWQLKAESKLPGTVGTVVSVTSLSDDPNTVDVVGEIVIDLYGTTQTLSSVTTPDIEGGANLALAGHMLFNFADAAQVSGYPNRWTLTTLLNGQKGTDQFVADVGAGDRFVLINDAVKFVPMDIEDLNVEYDYRAVTIGQSLDDAATIPAVWTGGLVAPRRMNTLVVTKDASDYWLIQARGNPRPSEEPAEYECLLGTSDDWSDEVANTVLTLPMVTGTSQGVLFAATSGEWNPETEMLETTNHAYKNNVTPVIGAVFNSSVIGCSIQAIEQDFQRFDFELTTQPALLASGALDVTDFGDGVLAAVVTRSTPTITPPVEADCPLSVQWTVPSDYDYDTYPEGTVRETWRSYSTVLLVRDGIDPGNNPFGLDGDDIVDGNNEPRKGPRYSFLLNGNELSAHKDYKVGGGHIVKVALGDTIPYPMRLITRLMYDTGGSYLRNGMISGNIFPSTILSKRDQENPATWGAAQTTLYGLIRQKSRILGIKGEPFTFAVTP